MKRFLNDIAEAWRPHPGQRRFLMARAPYRALACGRRWGKTDACAVEVAARLHAGGEGNTLLVAPTLDQARIIFERLLDLLENLAERWPARFPMPHLRHSPFLRLALGDQRVVARSGHRPRSLRGHGADHIVVDEAAYVAPGILGEVLFPMVATSPKATLTLVSTPSGFGEFQRFFERGTEGKPRFWSRTAPTAENPRVAPSFLDLMQETLPEPTYAREFQGRFAGAENGLFAFESVRNAVSPAPILPGPSPFFAGLDLARTRDWTALVVLEGVRENAKTVFVDRWRGLGWERQLHRVGTLLEAFPRATLRMDGTGAGDPVVEWARRVLPHLSIQSIVFGADNKRSLMDNLAVLLQSATLTLPDHRELTDELLAFVESRPAASKAPEPTTT